MADELPPQVAQQQAAAAQPAYKTSIMGYRVLNPGETPQAGVVYGMGEYSSQVYRVNQAGSTEVWKATEYNPNAAPPVAPGPTGLYLSYQNLGREPVVSAVYTAGAVPFVGNFNGSLTDPATGQRVTVAQAVNYGAGYTSPNGGSSSKGGQSTGDVINPPNPYLQTYTPPQGFTPSAVPSGGYYGMEGQSIIGQNGAPLPVAQGAAVSTGNVSSNFYGGTYQGTTPLKSSTGDQALGLFMNATPTGLDAGGPIKAPFISTPANPSSSTGWDKLPVQPAGTTYGYGEPMPSAEYINNVMKSFGSSAKQNAEIVPPLEQYKNNPSAVNTALAIAPAIAYGGEKWNEIVSKGFDSLATGMEVIAPSAVKPAAHVAGQVVSGVGSTVYGGIPAFFMSIPNAVQFVATNTGAVPAKTVEVVGETVGGYYDLATSNPEKFVGSVIGLVYAGKITQATVDIPGKFTGAIKQSVLEGEFGVAELGGSKLLLQTGGQTLEQILGSDRLTVSRTTSVPEISGSVKPRATEAGGEAQSSYGAEGVFVNVPKDGGVNPLSSFARNVNWKGNTLGQSVVNLVTEPSIANAKNVGNTIVKTAESVVLRPRTYLFEEIKTVDLPEGVKTDIIKSVRETGTIPEGLRQQMYDIAQEQSTQLGEPVLVPSPKLASYGEGYTGPLEAEAFMVFGKGVSTRFAQTQIAGVQSTGNLFFGERRGLVTKVSFNPEGQLSTTGITQSFAENLDWNLQRGANLRQMTNADIVRNFGEQYGNELSFREYKYTEHGPEHAGAVADTATGFFRQNPSRFEGMSETELKVAGQLHDIAKQSIGESGVRPHAQATAEAIRSGALDSALEQMGVNTPAGKARVAEAIGGHTDIKPFNINNVFSKDFFATVKTAVTQPSEAAKVIATADRLDLTRMGIEPNPAKMWSFDNMPTAKSTTTTVPAGAILGVNLGINVKIKETPSIEQTPTPEATTYPQGEVSVAGYSTPRGPNQNTFTGWTPEDYLKPTTEPVAYPSETSVVSKDASYTEAATTSLYSAPSGYGYGPTPVPVGAATYPSSTVMPYATTYPLAGAPAAYPDNYKDGYTKPYTTTYTPNYAENYPTKYTDNYTQNYTKNYSGGYGGNYPSNYSQGYTNNYKSAYPEAYPQNYAGKYVAPTPAAYEPQKRLIPALLPTDEEPNRRPRSKPKRFTETFSLVGRTTYPGGTVLKNPLGQILRAERNAALQKASGLPRVQREVFSGSGSTTLPGGVVGAPTSTAFKEKRMETIKAAKKNAKLPITETFAMDVNNTWNVTKKKRKGNMKGLF